MIAFVMAVLASQTAATGGSDEFELSGTCRYNQTVIERRDRAVLVRCDTLSIDRDVKEGRFDFSQSTWGSTMQFRGEMNGNRMVVSGVTLRSGRSLPATGTCKIFLTNEMVSTVSCLAKVGAKYYAANFEPSRF